MFSSFEGYTQNFVYFEGVFCCIQLSSKSWNYTPPNTALHPCVFSFKAGEHIFARGTALGKRVQSNMGAKNHAVVMPDANRQGKGQYMT